MRMQRHQQISSILPANVDALFLPDVGELGRVLSNFVKVRAKLGLHYYYCLKNYCDYSHFYESLPMRFRPLNLNSELMIIMCYCCCLHLKMLTLTQYWLLELGELGGLMG